MVNQTTRYALQILGYLAHGDDALVPGEHIARDIGIPANYLSKILNQLRKSGMVESRKGWGGGFRLRADAHQLPLLDVVRVFEGDRPVGMPACIFGLPACNDDQPCPLHAHWSGIRESFGEMLRTTTVGDLKGRSLVMAPLDTGIPCPRTESPDQG
jgi:Rrf2 family protein